MRAAVDGFAGHSVSHRLEIPWERDTHTAGGLQWMGNGAAELRQLLRFPPNVRVSQDREGRGPCPE